MKKYILSIFIMISFSSCSKYENPSEMKTEAPVVETIEVNNVTRKSAHCEGNIVSTGGLPIDMKGFCWSTHPNPTIADNITYGSSDYLNPTKKFIGSIQELAFSTTYYLCAYAKNQEGIGYGKIVSFKTGPLEKPSVMTFAPQNISLSSVICGGEVGEDGGSQIIEYGICWGTTPTPTIEDNKVITRDGKNRFSFKISGLSENSIYYSRAYATNGIGTNYGVIYPFRTLSSDPNLSGTVTDIDGNIYNYITIGTQKWMVQNLKTTKYRNGESIKKLSDGPEWPKLTTGAYCDYNNNPDTAAIYGKLYNWYAVNDSRSIAPPGWHVATVADWNILIDFFGGPDIAGAKLKESGDVHWTRAPNSTFETNESGFTALPGGYLGVTLVSGNFLGMHDNASWWSSSEYNEGNAWGISTVYYLSGINNNHSGKKNAYSVRCVKD